MKTIRKSDKESKSGYISAITGSLITIKGLENYVHLHELIRIVKLSTFWKIVVIGKR